MPEKRQWGNKTLPFYRSRLINPQGIDIPERRNSLVRKELAFFILIVLSLGVAGCAAYQAASDGKPIAIVADRDAYSPIMSSTVGIGLTPQYPADVDNRTVSFRWQADYGYFLSWGAPDFKVGDLTNDTTTGDGKVYWSYSPDEMGKEKPPVHVTLTMLDKASGKAIGHAGTDIGWSDKDMATVNKK
jgi:hypothetical protein